MGKYHIIFKNKGIISNHLEITAKPYYLKRIPKKYYQRRNNERIGKISEDDYIKLCSYKKEKNRINFLCKLLSMRSNSIDSIMFLNYGSNIYIIKEKKKMQI